MRKTLIKFGAPNANVRATASSKARACASCLRRAQKLVWLN